MSENNTSDSYEVGYGKPPRSTQFRKGVSGNPKGRPKKTLDFDHELIKESESFLTINENGRRRRISKHRAAIIQVINKAIGGNMPALRTYLNHYQRALEKVAVAEASQSSLPRKYDNLSTLTDAELEEIIANGPKDQK